MPQARIRTNHWRSTTPAKCRAYGQVTFSAISITRAHTNLFLVYFKPVELCFFLPQTRIRTHHWHNTPPAKCRAYGQVTFSAISITRAHTDLFLVYFKPVELRFCPMPEYADIIGAIFRRRNAAQMAKLRFQPALFPAHTEIYIRQTLIYRLSYHIYEVRSEAPN